MSGRPAPTRQGAALRPAAAAPYCFDVAARHMSWAEPVPPDAVLDLASTLAELTPDLA
uniref:hypothetical protein n=1 Tax=Streptomyces sp. F12 TaxID=1436084 RepID=UPI0015E82BEB|nr:hypothetical protein [Streptomyces sp. F12]